MTEIGCLGSQERRGRRGRNPTLMPAPRKEQLGRGRTATASKALIPIKLVDRSISSSPDSFFGAAELGGGTAGIAGTAVWMCDLRL